MKIKIYSKNLSAEMTNFYSIMQKVTIGLRIKTKSKFFS